MSPVVRAPSRERGGVPRFSAGEDRLAPPVVDIRRRDVVEPLVVPAMVVEVDEVGHRRMQPARARIDEQVQARLQRLGPKTGSTVERPCARDASICRMLQGDGDEVSNT